MSTPSPMARLVFDTRRLVADHPPRLVNAHKKLVYSLACPPGEPHAGTLHVTRWALLPLPGIVPGHMPEVARHDGFFTYPEAEPGSGEMIWHVNFADAVLFGYYGGPLLAQDELQVAEHPALASLHEALAGPAGDELPPLTRGHDGSTPILVRGAERRCRLATEPDAAEGRPAGLYGHLFSKASAEAVERAVKPIRPPTLTHLIAMEAPKHGAGVYTREDILDVLVTAMTAFAAARQESASADAMRTAVHTGFWGCGVYGGNRTLMALLQLLASRLAGLDRLVFHATGPGGSRAFGEACVMLTEDAPDGEPLPRVVDRLVDRRFRWGIGDGN